MRSDKYYSDKKDESPSHEEVKAKIESDVEEFLRKGGEIEVIESEDPNSNHKPVKLND